PRAGTRRRRARGALADADRARSLVPAIEAPSGTGRRTSRVPTRAARSGRDQGEGRRAPGVTQGRAAHEQAHLWKRLQEPRPRAHGRTDARGLRAAGRPRLVSTALL